MAEPDSAAQPTERSFEQALGELERRVKQLDGGDLPLEQALALFEEGVSLVQECHDRLDGAERRIVELAGTPDNPQERPIGP